jgi:hypothetical protein
MRDWLDFRVVGKQSPFRTSDPLVQLLLTDQCARRREREVVRVALRAHVQTQTILRRRDLPYEMDVVQRN